MKYHEIDYRKTKYSNAYQVIDRTGPGTWKALGTVAKVEGYWIAELLGERSEPHETRWDAVEDCLIMSGALPA